MSGTAMSAPAQFPQTSAWRLLRQCVANRSAAHSHGTGSTLTEVLVTVAVLATGLLLTTSLLTESLRALGETRQQQRALRLAGDLGELLGNLDAALVRSTTNPAAYDCAHMLCTPAQFLADSLQRWQIRTTQLLPDGAGRVDFVHNGDETLAAISVQWSSHDGSLTKIVSQVALLDRP